MKRNSPVHVIVEDDVETLVNSAGERLSLPTEIGSTRTVQKFTINCDPENGQTIDVDFGIGATDYTKAVVMFVRVIEDDVGTNDATGVVAVISNSFAVSIGGKTSIGFGPGMNSYMAVEPGEGGDGGVGVAVWDLNRDESQTAFGTAIGEAEAFNSIYLNDQDNDDTLDETASVVIEVTTIVYKMAGPTFA